MTERWPNLQFDIAGEVFQAYPQMREDLTALPDGRPTLDYLTVLAESPTPEEALTFAAYALARRHAIWWAHECLRRAEEVLTPDDEAMMGLAAAWVGQPDEANRYAALDAAFDAQLKTPGVWLAMAAGWSGGSLAPPNSTKVPMPPFLCGRAVNIAVLSALARVAQGARPDTLRAFVKMARTIAEER